MSSPKYEVTYFDARGRGEFVRLILESQGIPYKDNRVKFDEWGAKKATTPLGALPVLTIHKADGKTDEIPQTNAILRRLGRDLNMCGKNEDEVTQVDVLLETIVDLMNFLISIVVENDPAKKKEKMDNFQAEGYKQHFANFEKRLAISAGEEGYAVGNSLTIADLTLYHVIEMAKCDDKVGDYKLLSANRKKVASEEKIAKYIAGRKEAPF